MRGRRRGADAGEDAPADAVQALAVLLRAGLHPGSAWAYLAEQSPIVAPIAAAIASGRPIPAAIEDAGGDWADVGRAWRVAAQVGAPLAETLQGFAEGLRDAADARDDVRVALAEPTGTARLMLWLPAAGAALGAALGFDVVGAVLGDVRGALCVIAGIALIVAARVWTARLVARAQPPAETPGLEASLFAIALAGGVSLDRAAHIAGGGSIPDRVRAILELSRRAGVPAVELLRAEASRARHRARVAGRTAAAQLATRLLLPLGVCTLPSFLLLAVAPLVLSVLDSAVLPAF